MDEDAKTDEMDFRALMSEGLETVSGAVKWTKLSRSLLYKMMEDGRLAYVKIGRSRRIPRRALVALAVDSLRVIGSR